METLPAHLDEVLDQHDAAEVAPRRPRGEEEEMDITPMIDITFLLLIYFIVASTPDQQTAIQLPNAQNGVAVAGLNSTVFTIGDGDAENAPVYEADGKIESARLSDDEQELRRQVKEAIERGMQENKQNVIIKADKTVAYRNVDRLLKAISKVEGVKIHFAVLEER